MQEQSLFTFEDTESKHRPITIEDAKLDLYENAFSRTQADRFLESIMHATPWRRDSMQIHGKTVPIPRLQAWYADDGISLSYSGMNIPALSWSDDLLEVRTRIKALTGHQFNSVLVNCYRDGNDSVGWHSDDEAQWGDNPVIASVSFGAVRDFVLKHKTNNTLAPVKCALAHGSVLVMGETVQHHWLHQLPKRKRINTPRINLTFRNVIF